MGNFWLLLFLFLTLSQQGSYSQGSLGFSMPEGKNRVVIPIEIYGNIPVVQVVLNGLLPLRFIVDTGVRTAILMDKQLSDFLDLQYSRKLLVSGPGNERTIGALVTHDLSLALPGISSSGHSMLVLEEDYIQMSSLLGVEVHGILGYELFSRFIVEINYAKETMTLHRPERFRVRRGFEEIQLMVDDTKPFISGEVSLGSSVRLPVKLLVDTGASHEILLEPVSDTALQVPIVHVEGLLGRGLGGEIMGKIARVESFQFGQDLLQSVIVHFPNPNDYRDSLFSSTLNHNGTVGGGLLNKFTVIFDYSHEVLYYRANSRIRQKSFFNLSGLDIKATGKSFSTFEVFYVREGSPGALAGIQAGDVIVSLDSKSLEYLNLNEFNSLLNGRKQGKRMTLTIRRNQELLTKIIKLVSQI